MSIFHEPWWLDAVAPGAWGEVRAGHDGSTGTLQFAERRMGGLLVRLGAPALTPRLGPVLDISAEHPARRLDAEIRLTTALLAGLPRHDLFVTTLDYDLLNSQPYLWAGFQVQPRISHVLELDAGVSATWQNFHSRAKRAIKKAEGLVAVEIDSTTDRLGETVRATFDRQRRAIPYSLDLLRRAHAAAATRGQGEVLTAVDDAGAVHASILVVWDRTRTTYLVGGADSTLRASGAPSLLLWEAIKRSAPRSLQFDFEGSMLPGVAEFMRSFGAQPLPYFRVLHAGRAMRLGLAAREAIRALRDRPPEEF